MRPRKRGVSLPLLTVLMGALTGAAADAKPSIAIIPFGHHPVERQLTKSLCAEVTCIDASKVMRHGRVDWDSVAAAHLTAVLVGKTTRDPTTQKRLVDIQLQATAKVILVRKRAPLTNLSLSTDALHTMTVDLVGVLNRAHGPDRPVAPVAAGAVAGAAATSATAPTPVGPPSPSAPPGPTASPTEALALEPPVEPMAVPAATEREPSLLEVQVTLAMLSRHYLYSGGENNTTLRDSTIPLAGEPSLLVGVFPVRSPTGFFESVGIEAGVATSVGMYVERSGDTTGKLFPATSVAANVGVLARLRLSKVLRLAPMVGWQMMNFTVNKAGDGTVLSGEPTVHWRAFRVGLKLDVNFTTWLALYVEASYLYVYSAGELTRAPYFSSFLSAPSFDTALGVSFRVAPQLEVRLGILFTRYALSFSGSGPAPVSGVSDQMFGGTLGFRYSE